MISDAACSTIQLVDFDGPQFPTDFTGLHPQHRMMQEILRRIARSTLPVLLIGQRGTEVAAVARAIHDQSRRSRGAFVTARCGLYSGGSMERRFFGASEDHRRAHVRRPGELRGQIEAAHRGTLFIEQVQFATPLMQERLLKLLERRHGATARSEHGEPDVRIVASAATSLHERAAGRRFDGKLAEQLSVAALHVPSCPDRTPQDRTPREPWNSKFAASPG